MENLILVILLFLGIFVLIFSTYFILMYFKYINNKTIYNELKSKIIPYQTQDLVAKLKIIKEVLAFGINQEEYDDYNESLTRLTQGEFREIMIVRGKIDEWFSKWYKPIYRDYQRKFQDLDEVQFDYIKSFLLIRFRMNESLLNKELQETIIYKVRDLFSEVSEISRSKLHNEIIESKPFMKKIIAIENKISKLEQKSYTNNKTEDSISDIREIVKDIQSAHMDGLFLLNALNFLKYDLPSMYKEFKETYLSNPDVFSSLEEKFKKILKYAKLIQKDALMNAMQLKKSTTKKQLIKLNEEINKIISEAKLNRESYNFIIKYENSIIKLINEFEIKKHYLVEEINRYQIGNKEIHIKTINDYSQRISNQIHIYQKSRKETFRIHTPYKLAIELSKMVEQFEEYLEHIRNNIQDINEIIKQTDEINKEIAKMNVMLLDVETKMSGLPSNIQYKRKENFENLQFATSKVIEMFKDNTEKIPEDIRKTVEILYKKINEFKNKVGSEAYVFNYIKWVIMELNKYINTDEDFIKLLNKVEEEYHKANSVEALRIAKNITDLYRIYE